MGTKFPISICQLLWLLFGAYIGSAFFTVALGAAIIVVIDYPIGLREMLKILNENYRLLITGSITVFSSSFGIFSVLLSIMNQRNRDKEERKRRLSVFISKLPNAFSELSELCKNLTLIVAGRSDKVNNQETQLSKDAFETINSTIEYSEPEEIKIYQSVIKYYKMAITRFNAYSKESQGDSTRELTRKERELIVDLVSLQSIAELYSYLFFNEKTEFNSELLKRQFEHNMHRYNVVKGEMGRSIEDIELQFKLKLDGSSDFSEGYFGFLKNFIQ